MKNKIPVVTTDAPNPVGPYSQAVVLDNTVYCSGQLGLDPTTGTLVGEEVGAQTRRCMENLQAVLKAAGSSLDGVLRTTIYITRIADFPAVNAVYGEFFQEPYPARATVEVSGLALGAVVEIDAVATVSGSQADS